MRTKVKRPQSKRQASGDRSIESIVGRGSCFDLTRDLFDSPEKLGASNEGDRSVNKARGKSFGRPRK
jgi:hypothetical protein